MTTRRLFKLLNISPLYFLTNRLWMAMPCIALACANQHCASIGVLNKYEDDPEELSIDYFDDIEDQNSDYRENKSSIAVESKEHDFTYIGTSFCHVCMFSEEEFSGGVVDLINMPDSVSVGIDEESEDELYMF